MLVNFGCNLSWLKRGLKSLCFCKRKFHVNFPLNTLLVWSLYSKLDWRLCLQLLFYSPLFSHWSVLSLLTTSSLSPAPPPSVFASAGEFSLLCCVCVCLCCLSLISMLSFSAWVHFFNLFLIFLLYDDCFSFIISSYGAYLDGLN